MTKTMDRRQRFHIVMIVLVVLVIVAVLTLVALRQPSGGVRIGGANSLELTLPTLVAYARGYFVDENLRLGDLVIGSGSNMRDALIAGNLDVGLLAFIHTPLARSRGSDLKIVMSVHNRQIFSLLVRSSLRGEVREIPDLKHRTIGVTKPGSGSWALLRAFVESAGIDPDKDITVVALGGDASAIYAALKTERVDAIVSWEPITSRALENKIAFPLVRSWIPEDYANIVMGTTLSMTLVVRETTIAKNEDLVRRLVVAHQRALNDIENYDAEEIAELIVANSRTAQYVSSLDRSLLVAIISRIKDGFGDGSISKAGFATEMEFLLAHDLVEARFNFDDAVDARFAGASP